VFGTSHVQYTAFSNQFDFPLFQIMTIKRLFYDTKDIISSIINYYYNYYYCYYYYYHVINNPLIHQTNLLKITENWCAVSCDYRS